MGHKPGKKGSGKHGSGNGHNSNGKGNGNSNSNSKKPNTSTKPQPLNKFGVSNNTTTYAPYATVVEKITQHIQSTYDYGIDTAKSIRNGTKIDLVAEKPICQIAEGTTEEKASLQPAYDIEFTQRMNECLKRERWLNSNLPKACACIFGSHVTDGLKSRLQAMPDFNTKIQDDPLALLRAIKTQTHENARTQYPPITITTHLDRLLRIKQESNEDPATFAKRFQQQLDTVQGYLGPRFTDGYAEQTPEYKAAAYVENPHHLDLILDGISDEDQRRATKDALNEMRSHYQPKETPAQVLYKQKLSDSFNAFLFLRSATRSKYGSLLTTLQTQYSLGKDQYPNTITRAVDILSQHPWDKAPAAPPKKDNSNSNSRSPGNDSRNNGGNQSSNQRNNNNSNSTSRSDGNNSSSQTNASFAQQRGRAPSTSNAVCHQCGALGHVHQDCSQNIPRDQWFIRRAVVAHQQGLIPSSGPPVGAPRSANKKVSFVDDQDQA